MTDLAASAREGQAAYLAGLLAEALRQHRRDMHSASPRPCSTCDQSAKALAAFDRWQNALIDGSDG